MNGEIQHAFGTPISRFQVPESESAPVNAALKSAIFEASQTYTSLGVDPGTPSGDHPFAGQLEFLDARGRAEMAATPGDPFGDPIRVESMAGLIVIFPSWLYHWVHPYAGEGSRIAVSFNFAVKAVVAG